MVARMTPPAGTAGSLSFDGSAFAEPRTVEAVRTEDGTVWARIRGSLWLVANVRPEQFTPTFPLPNTNPEETQP